MSGPAQACQSSIQIEETTGDDDEFEEHEEVEEDKQ